MLARNTRLLFLVALAAAALFVFIELPRRRSEEREHDTRTRLVEFDAAMADRVLIQRGGEVIDLARRDGRWVLLAPVTDLGEPSAVASLLDALAGARVTRDLGAIDDVSRYGLAPPAATLRVLAGADTVAMVSLGGYTVERDAVYARRPGGPVILVPTDLLRAVTLPVDAYRNQRVLVFDRETITRFILCTRDEDSSWRRSGESNWYTVVRGDTIAGDSTAVESILRIVHGLRATRFLSPQDTSRALDHPEVILTIHRRVPDAAETVRFRCANGECMARRDGEQRILVVDHDLAMLRAGGLSTLRDRRMFHFAPEHATRIEVVTPDTSAVLVRAGDRWGLPNPALGAIDAGLAADFVRTLRGARWRDIAHSAPPAHGSGRAFSIVIRGAANRVLDSARGRLDEARSDYVVDLPAAHLRVRVDAAFVTDLTYQLRRMRSQTSRRP